MSANLSNTFYEFLEICRKSPIGNFSMIAFTIANGILLLPLCTYIIYLGLQQRRRRRSGAVTSHFNHITYHMVVIELMNVVGCVLSCSCVVIDVPAVSSLIMYIFSISLYGQQNFHILTCLDRYLAVVHPVTYLSLRGERGIRIRNICVSCVWLLTFSCLGFLSVQSYDTSFYICFCLTGLYIIVISFCSLFVLCVLIHPGPGEGGGGTKPVDQSKLRAFYTIIAILGALMLRFGGNVVCAALSLNLALTEMCLLWSISLWFCLPSGLVQPLLFLHRARKLPGSRRNLESGQGSD